MLPVYDPKSFASVDLRKYHIRDIADVIKFNEFVSSRMEEASFILKKFNTQYSTYKTVSKQLQDMLQKQQNAYGNPNPSTADVQSVTPGEIQKVDETTSEEIHKDLLDDIKQAVANETLVPDEGEDPNERAAIELGKYKAVQGKNRVMFYREGKMVGANDVPEDIREQLVEALDDQSKSNE